MSKANDNTNQTPSPAGFLTTGDVALDDVLRSLNATGLGARARLQLLARCALYCTVIPLADETESMTQAREAFRNVAMMLDRAVMEVVG